MPHRQAETHGLCRWMDGWMDGWTDGWMDGWMNGRTDSDLGPRAEDAPAPDDADGPLLVRHGPA
eukprot:CAMPEP_0113685566 /NCGR_PEP_ID=MMETSP0038_2-20120614/14755_1 /TAXON_ID=2898 /ORGANISM="Cryptomonas paramecium" /LENGTH=63 /DNA_ID=CAMNT_0000605691 /DNA_START=98 /DNA_END=285 /DNA_ORIENTATION=+ /assembly_acc=CAM_ASM_000170